jgi:long-chain fatty acid transport protein
MSARKHLLTTTTIACLTAFTSTSYASGFRVPEITVTGTATSNALIANTEDVGALAFNPASMSFHDATVAQFGVNYVSYEASVNPAGGTPTDSTGEDSFLIPNITLMIPGNSMSFGLMINSPFGLETKWPTGTFPQLSINPQLEPATSRIKMFNVNPNVAFKIDESTSFAVGLDFYDVPELVFNTHASKITGNGSGVGWNIAYTKKLGKFNIGASYRSSVKTDITGSANDTFPATASVEFPDLFQAGVYFQATEKFAVEFDIEHIGWSSFDKVAITTLNPTPPPFTATITSTNNWEDTWVYRLGFYYQMTPATKLMFGYSFDETPQPDSFFSARVPDADRQLFSVGVSHQFNNKWVMEAAYMYVDVDSRTINSSTAYVPPGDANGTTAYNGEYSTDVSLIGVSLTIPL